MAILVVALFDFPLPLQIRFLDVVTDIFPALAQLLHVFNMRDLTWASCAT